MAAPLRAEPLLTAVELSWLRWWHLFVAPEVRASTLRPFLKQCLRRSPGKAVVDLGAGLGEEVQFLESTGYTVTANEVDRGFNQRLWRLKDASRARMRITNADWRSVDQTLGTEQFDAALLLGNSFCLLLQQEERVKAARAIASIVRRGGILVLDERNFPRIRNRGAVSSAEQFEYSRRVLYCGTEIQGFPVACNVSEVLFAYEHRSGEPLGYLRMRPTSTGELPALFEQVGLELISVHYDLDTVAERRSADFLTYVFRKPV